MINRKMAEAEIFPRNQGMAGETQVILLVRDSLAAFNLGK